MKRQRGRNRGGGGSGGGGGGGKPQQNVNRAFDSNGPDNVKIRGHAQHVFEKYQQLARDAFASGDRVLAENYLQHADHYFRVLRTIQPQRPPAEILGRDVFASGLDIDFEEEMEPGEDNGEGQLQPEGEPAVGGESNPQQDGRRDNRYEGRRDNGYEYRDSREGQGREGRRDNPEGRELRREGGDRFENNRNGEPREGRAENRNTENRNEGRNEPRGEPREGQRFDRREGRRFREDRPPREDRREGRADESEAPRDPLAVVAVASEASSFPPAESVETESSPVLRSQDGGVSEAPAFLQGAPASEDGEPRRPRARRRRAPRTFEGGEEGGETPAPAAEEA
jgi:hypothetical protein